MSNGLISIEEFMRIAGTESFKRANAIMEQRGTQFTRYSAYQDIVDKILENQDDDEVLAIIAEDLEVARRTETIVHAVIRERERNANKKSGLDRFFDAFNNRLTKERLFILLGETGVGKTWITEKYYPDMITYACNSSLDPFSLCYSLENIDGVLTPQETPFLRMLKSGGKVKLDEFNLLPHDTLMFIQGITDEKESVVVGSETIKISADFRILATMNPPSESDIRSSLGDALLGRAVGFTMELTDDVIVERLGVSYTWLKLIRKMHTFLASSGMIDVRELNYRSYQRFIKYGVEEQMKFMFTSTDVANIRTFNTCAASYEYTNLLTEIEMEMQQW